MPFDRITAIHSVFKTGCGKDQCSTFFFIYLHEAIISMISGFGVVWIQTSESINDLRHTKLTLKYFWLELEDVLK